MDLPTLLAQCGGSIYFDSPHAVLGEAVEAAVNEAYPDAKIEATHEGAFHFIQVLHGNGAISSYMFAEEVSA